MNITSPDDYEESVHDRWSTYNPGDWHGCRDADHLYDVLTSTYRSRVRNGLIGKMSSDEIRRDADLLWQWVASARAAREA